MVAFKQVDVFTSVPFKGNPVAVILDASSLSTDEMKAIANWTNLSETTFVLPPTNNLKADYKLRIFVPSGEELSFAGHPTIGTAFALLESGLIIPKDNNLIQECGAGLINLKIDKININNNKSSISIFFELPIPIITSINENQLIEIENFLNSKINISSFYPSIVNVGPKWLVINLLNANNVLNLKPNFEKMKVHNQNLKITGVCVFGFYENSENQIEVRSFAPACNINEDPVCGSGNGSVAALVRKFYKNELNNSTISLNSTQGSKLGRDGHINLQFTKDKILVGGNAVTCIKGDINI